MKVAVLGAAGGIGQALALLLKNRLPAGSELSLYDIAPVTPGVAADLSHIPTDVKVKGFCGEDPSPALVGADVVPKAPGMKYTHYAPKAPLTLIEGMPTRMARAFQREVTRLQGEGHVVGVIASHEVLNELRGLLPANLMADYGHQGSLPAIAANIYEALRSFDDQPADVLLGEGTAEQGLGLAIMNRLHKASGFRTIRA